ncbi:MAG: peptidase S1, partial [Mycobacterium sp.]
MTDDPRYSASQQPGRGRPNPQATQGYTQAGYQQPYDWRYATAQQAAQQNPQQQYGYGGYPPRPTGPGPQAPREPRKRSRAAALTVGALAIAAVSAGMGGAVATMVKPDGTTVTTMTTAAPNGKP